MTPEQQRIAIASACGFTGCNDAACHYRKAQHLHKDGRVFFPESYSIPMYPNYPEDLNAMHEAWGYLNRKQCLSFSQHLREIVVKASGHNRPSFKEDIISWCENAPASQRAEALLRTIGKWVES